MKKSVMVFLFLVSAAALFSEENFLSFELVPTVYGEIHQNIPLEGFSADGYYDPEISFDPALKYLYLNVKAQFLLFDFVTLGFRISDIVFYYDQKFSLDKVLFTPCLSLGFNIFDDLRIAIESASGIANWHFGLTVTLDRHEIHLGYKYEPSHWWSLITNTRIDYYPAVNYFWIGYGYRFTVF